MTVNDALGARMKDYELETRTTLPERSYTVLRLDGRAFHTYLRNAQKPFDYGFITDMQETAKYVCSEISGSVFAYTQSDEISVLIQDFASPSTQPWFGGQIQKMTSVSASLATAKLNDLRSGPKVPLATFDARVFTLPSAVEVANYFLWRQQDCSRNALSMAAQAQFSHKELHGKGKFQLNRMLEEKGIFFDDDYSVTVRFGSVVVQEQVERETTYTNKRTGEVKTTSAVRSSWLAEEAPVFYANAGWLVDTIPEKP